MKIKRNYLIQRPKYGSVIICPAPRWRLCSVVLRFTIFYYLSWTVDTHCCNVILIWKVLLYFGFETGTVSQRAQTVSMLSKRTLSFSELRNNNISATSVLWYLIASESLTGLDFSRLPSLFLSRNWWETGQLVLSPLSVCFVLGTTASIHASVVNYLTNGSREYVLWKVPSIFHLS